jgi:hypothetical protein
MGRMRRGWTVAAIAIALLVGEGSALARRRPNMPEGWTWPPSKEMRKDGRKCLEDLRAMGLRFEKSRKKRKIATPIVVPEMKFGELVLKPTYRKPPFVMDCRLARGLVQYAPVLTSLGISALHFSSIYDYRKVRSRRGGRGALSRHALGLAIDVFEIGLKNGTVAVVKDHYWSNSIVQLTEMWLQASGGFRAILSPSIDPASHGDHLHLEIAVFFPESEKEKRKKAKAAKARARKAKAKARARARAAKRKQRKKGKRGAVDSEEPFEPILPELTLPEPESTDDGETAEP